MPNFRKIGPVDILKLWEKKEKEEKEKEEKEKEEEEKEEEEKMKLFSTMSTSINREPLNRFQHHFQGICRCTSSISIPCLNVIGLVVG